MVAEMGMAPEALSIALDREAEVPLGVQLAWALRGRVRDGRLRPGQRLPGLREFADALDVNVNTVRAVYQRLQHDGVIDTRRGDGTFIATGSSRSPAVADIAASAARDAIETGVDPRDVAAALYMAPRQTGEHTDDGATPRRRLRAQIATLEQALAELYVKVPPDQRPRPGTERQTGPRILGLDELEDIRAQLLRRLAAAQAAIDH